MARSYICAYNERPRQSNKSSLQNAADTDTPPKSWPTLLLYPFRSLPKKQRPLPFCASTAECGSRSRQPDLRLGSPPLLPRIARLSIGIRMRGALFTEPAITEEPLLAKFRRCVAPVRRRAGVQAHAGRLRGSATTGRITELYSYPGQPLEVCRRRRGQNYDVFFFSYSQPCRSLAVGARYSRLRCRSGAAQTATSAATNRNCRHVSRMQDAV